MPIQEGRTALDRVNMGKGTFAFLDPLFDPDLIVLQQSEFSPEKLVEPESQALHRGYRAFRQILGNLGATGDWVS